ncbi:MAG: UbiA prenyltransferase family protein [Polyangiaceae bacterium]|nr:UbiA prenyltransferase family protein [Polyangiaceae bacterium]
MSSALRILFDVAVFRLRRLEMANLAGAISVMIALRLTLVEMVVRTGFALLLNLLAYLTNDYCDLDRDLQTGRAQEKTRFLAEHRGAALGAQWALVALLSAIALVHSPGLLLALSLGAGLCWLYSAKVKRVPFADVLAMAICGGAMALVAVPLDRGLGWLLVGQLGLFSGAFELIQVLRDRQEDAAAGVVTTAVKLGEARTLLLLRLWMALSAAFATLTLHRFVGPALALAILLPYGQSGAKTYWNRVRLVFGLAWLAMIVATVLGGGGHGLWLATGAAR